MLPEIFMQNSSFLYSIFLYLFFLRCLPKAYVYFQERVSDPAAKSSQFSARPNVPPYAPAPQMITMDNDDDDDDVPYAGQVLYLVIFFLHSFGCCSLRT
jgi:hypothetical protein